MGVLACNRTGCNNIMCDYYSDEYGYICSECLNELKKKPFTEIRSFMQSPKPSTVSWYCDWEDLIDQEFKSRYGD